MQPATTQVDNSFRHTSCPACGASGVRKIGDLRYGPDATFGTTRITLLRTPELWACESCGSWFTQNVIEPGVAGSIYAEGRSDERWQAQGFEVSKTKPLLRAVERLLKRGSPSVIDVGCNTGELLDYCAQRGATTSGVELSAASRKVCEQKGHRMLSALRDAEGSADLVFAFDLMEHLHDLNSFFADARRALRPEGRLVVLSGDNTSLPARASRQRWWYLQYPEHIVFPSWRSMTRIPGFELVARLRTYASIGYRNGPLRRAWGAGRMLLGRGNGMPLVCGDHHLLVLQKQ